MVGWIFEFLFFSKLTHSGVQLYDGGIIKKSWPKAQFSSVNPDKQDFPCLSIDGGVWLKPVKWNQGGYDAVFIDKKAHQVCFVQITKSVTHKFSLRFFANFLGSLQNSQEQFEVKKLEVIFVVDEGKFSNFKLDVENPGMLKAFENWQFGKEVENAEVLIMHADDDPFPSVAYNC